MERNNSRVAIYWPSSGLAPVGGPPGYLFNLKTGLDGSDSVCFVAGEGFPCSIKSAIPQRIRKLRLAAKYSTLYKQHRPASDCVTDFCAVHFHSTEDLFLARKWLEQYPGKVVLTSHTPCAPHVEKANSLESADIRLFQDGLSHLQDVDEFAFKRADYVVFPCAGAEEPYYHTWNDYSDLRDPRKVKYIATGIAPCSARLSREAVRAKYGIPGDARVVSFVGRHDYIKGYDLLKQAASDLLRENANVWFLIAGNERPLKGLDCSRWIEAGWTDDPYSIVAASDFFALPNRETYFDLVMLEVLSLGKPVIASRTGGNRHFESFDAPGIHLYDGVDGLRASLAKFSSLGFDELEALGASNRALFDTNFTCGHFARRYLAFFDDILSKGEGKLVR